MSVYDEEDDKDDVGRVDSDAEQTELDTGAVVPDARVEECCWVRLGILSLKAGDSDGGRDFV